MEDRLIELLKDLKELKNKINEEKESNDEMDFIAFNNSQNAQNIIDLVNKDNSVEDAFNKTVRTYEQALAKCLEHGATADDKFMKTFTSRYVNAILGIVSNLFLEEDFIENKSNVEFLNSKINECLKYIDKL